jgi:hypothetical protein
VLIFLLAVLILVSASPFAALRVLPKRRLSAKRGGGVPRKYISYRIGVVFSAGICF